MKNATFALFVAAGLAGSVSAASAGGIVACDCPGLPPGTIPLAASASAAMPAADLLDGGQTHSGMPECFLRVGCGEHAP